MLWNFPKDGFKTIIIVTKLLKKIYWVFLRSLQKSCFFTPETNPSVHPFHLAIQAGGEARYPGGRSAEGCLLKRLDGRGVFCSIFFILERAPAGALRAQGQWLEASTSLKTAVFRVGFFCCPPAVNSQWSSKNSGWALGREFRLTNKNLFYKQYVVLQPALQVWWQLLMLT